MAFPDDVMDLHVDLFMRGEWQEMGPVSATVDAVWTAVWTAIWPGRRMLDWRRLLDQSISITVGRQDETSQTNPASVTVELDNPDGALTPLNPLSPWWPDVRRGIFMRIRVGDSVRFFGKVAEIKPTWPFGDLTLAGDPVGESRVTVTANGVLRSIGQSDQAHSPLYRKITRDPLVTDYWPMEDEADSEGAASAILDRGPRTMLLNNVTLGAQSTVPGASSMASVDAGDTARWNTKLSTPDESSGWNVNVMFECPKPPESGEIVRVMNVLTTGDPYRYVVDLTWNTNPRLHYQIFYRDGSLAEEHNSAGTTIFGLGPVSMELTCHQSGGNVLHDLRWRVIDRAAYAYGITTSPIAGTLGSPANFSGTAENCPSGGFSFGQLTVRRSITNYWALSAALGHAGEGAGTRLGRICTEEGISLTHAGSLNATPMGAQPTASVPDLLDDCAVANNGELFEQLDGYGLHFIPRASRYNQAVALTLDAAASEIANPFEPTVDDQTLTDDVTVQRTGGVKYRTSDEAFIEDQGDGERHATSWTQNLAYDSQVADVATWKLHVGTWEGLRVTQITMDMAVCPELIERWEPIRPGDRVQVVNLPPQWPPPRTLDLIFQGWTETLEPKARTVTANCTPAGPWTVGVLEDDILGRLDTAGSELAEDIDDTQTTFAVVTTDGPVWTDVDGPFDMLCDGEVWTVNSITGSSSPQTFTVTRGVNGIAIPHAAGLPLSLANPLVIAR